MGGMSTPPIDDPGLSAAEAAHRLAEDGPNALPGDGGRRWYHIVRETVRDPMFSLLLAAAALYLLLGDLQESLSLALMVLVVIGLTLYQEGRTERAVQALRDLSSPRALVIRDGREARIAGAEVVRGDLVVLREGDRVAADARLVEAHALKVDESLLTGESVPVTKHAHPREGVEIQVEDGSSRGHRLLTTCAARRPTALPGRAVT